MVFQCIKMSFFVCEHPHYPLSLSVSVFKNPKILPKNSLPSFDCDSDDLHIFSSLPSVSLSFLSLIYFFHPLAFFKIDNSGSKIYQNLGLREFYNSESFFSRNFFSQNEYSDFSRNCFNKSAFLKNCPYNFDKPSNINFFEKGRILGFWMCRTL